MSTRWIKEISNWLKALFRRDALSHEVNTELEQHIEFMSADLAEKGMSPEEARRAAMLKFGGVVRYEEESRDSWGVRVFQEIVQDIRYSARQLIKSRGFTIVAILTLAIGIGATTAIFSIVNSVVLRPLAYTDSEQLVEIRQIRPSNQRIRWPRLAAFEEWEKQVSGISDLAAVTPMTGNMTNSEFPVRIYGNLVTHNYFKTLGVQPILGRTFSPEEAISGHGSVFVLSYRFWQEQFGGSRDVINRIVQFNNQPYTIIGVLPKGVRAEAGGPKVFAPLARNVGDPTRTFLFSVVGRLKENVTLAQAQAELDVIAERLTKSNPDIWDDVGTRVFTLLEYQVRGVSALLYVLLGAVGFLLLIACVNVANLLLSRASTRQREIAVRTALGASRVRVIRQLLAESIMLAVIGGSLGILLAYWSMSVLLGFAPTTMPRLDEVRIDGIALIFSCTVTMLTGIGFGLVPALQATKVDLATAIKDGSRSVGDGRQHSRLRHTLVIAEVSLALILLIGAGLLTRSFTKLQETELGYNPEVVYVSRIQLERHKYPDEQHQRAFIDQALEQLASKPGILAAAFTSSFPHHQIRGMRLDIEARPDADLNNLSIASIFSITPDYFKVISNPLLRGRWFTERDRHDTPPVVIISKSLADQHFPDQNPLGQRIALTRDSTREWREIVGVVTDVKLRGPATAVPPQAYVPFDQAPGNQFMDVVRIKEGSPEPTALVTAAIHTVDPDMPVPTKMVCIAEYEDSSISVQRFTLFLFGVFSCVALLLAALGIYGVMAYSVSQRTNEIGVRMALGAQHADILRLILIQAAKLVSIGLLIGVGGAIAGTRFLTSILHEISPYDPTTFIIISAILAIVALIACYVPARRAAKVDPMIALRAE